MPYFEIQQTHYNMKQFKISIIIPTFNRKGVLQRCLKSVLSQKTDDLEIVLIDDGSSDGTKELIESSYLGTGFQYIYLDVNRGVNYARNRGIEKANGKYLLFLDSDDYLADNAISTVYSVVEKNEKAYCHFLFTVSDRANDQSLPNHEDITYLEWLQDSVSGDYCHVIEKHFFDSNKFFENFKAFPILNWLRIFKLTTPQLFTNTVVVTRDRNRHDSIGYTMLLDSSSRIETQFNANQNLLDIYREDLMTLVPNKFQNLVFRNIILGLAVGFYDKVGVLLHDDWKPESLVVKGIFNLVYKFRLGAFVKTIKLLTV